MQLDTTTPEANFIASTLLEIETLLPLLRTTQRTQRVNVLYGIPLIPSQVSRLATLARELGENSISVMIDHPDQVTHLQTFAGIAGFPACVFVKVDTGYHRAGLPPFSLNKNGLLERIVQAEKNGWARLLGLYSHSSLSYGARSAEEAMGYLVEEISGCKDALDRWVDLLPQDRELVVSVGATPQVACSGNLVNGAEPGGPGGGRSSAVAEELRSLLRDPCPGNSGVKVKIELHAGNYPVLDMQQVSTHARDGAGGLEEEIALSVVAEVCSVYNDGERGKPEALVAAGTLALGREPCQGYSGWGVLSSWRQKGVKRGDAGKRVIVERISQEHGVLAWEDAGQDGIPLEIGQVVKILPNHSCIAGAFYGWYFVVDSESDPDASRIVDVWIRGRSESTDPYLSTRFQ